MDVGRGGLIDILDGHVAVRPGRGEADPRQAQIGGGRRAVQRGAGTGPIRAIGTPPRRVAVQGQRAVRGGPGGVVALHQAGDRGQEDRPGAIRFDGAAPIGNDAFVKVVTAERERIAHRRRADVDRHDLGDAEAVDARGARVVAHGRPGEGGEQDEERQRDGEPGAGSGSVEHFGLRGHAPPAVPAARCWCVHAGARRWDKGAWIHIDAGRRDPDGRVGRLRDG
ncbi:MAG: hypothetical protein U0470_11515 [Anaerolineae bacterium]